MKKYKKGRVDNNEQFSKVFNQNTIVSFYVSRNINNHHRKLIKREIFNREGIFTDIHWNGEGTIFLSAFAYALSSGLIKRYSQKEDTVTLSGYQLLLGGVLTAVGLLLGGTVSVFYLNIFRTVIVFGLYFCSGVFVIGHLTEI